MGNTDSYRLYGRVAAVTSAAGGIGRAISPVLAAEREGWGAWINAVGPGQTETLLAGASAVALRASDEASGISGHLLMVEGGASGA